MLPKIIVATQFRQIIRWKQIFIHDGTTVYLVHGSIIIYLKS
jgi:hypothetical protein